MVNPLFLPVGDQRDAAGRHPRGVGDRVLTDIADGARCGGVNTDTDESAGFCELLSFENTVSGGHQQFGGRADMLVERDDQFFRQGENINR